MFVPVSLLILGVPVFGAADLSPEQITFFETKIRPVLSESCYECHAEDSEKLRVGCYWIRKRAGCVVVIPEPP